MGFGFVFVFVFAFVFAFVLAFSNAHVCALAAAPCFLLPCLMTPRPPCQARAREDALKKKGGSTRLVTTPCTLDAERLRTHTACCSQVKQAVPELVEKIQEDKKRVAKLEAAAQPLMPKKNTKDGFVKLVFRNGHVYEGQVGEVLPCDV
jgi:hypothetical protein